MTGCYSLPMRERELKLRLGAVGLVVVHVAPHAGARIETASRSAAVSLACVAPHAGARIEICKTRNGRHERKVAPHALGGVDNSTNEPARCGLRLFRVLRAVQMRTVFGGAPCLRLSVIAINGMAIPRQPATPLWWAVFFTAPLRVKQNPPGGGFWRVCCV